MFVYIRPTRGLFAFLIDGQMMDPFKIRETNKLLSLGHSHCKQLFCCYLQSKSQINLRTLEREKPVYEASLSPSQWFL